MKIPILVKIPLLLVVFLGGFAMGLFSVAFIFRFIEYILRFDFQGLWLIIGALMGVGGIALGIACCLWFWERF